MILSDEPPGRPRAAPTALLSGAGRTPEGAAWLATLPGLVRRVLRRWAGIDAVAAVGRGIARGTDAALWVRHHGGPPATLRAGLRRVGDSARLRDVRTG